MTRSEACALNKGDYVKFNGSDDLLRVVQPAQPKYVLLAWPDGSTEIPHVMHMEQFTLVRTAPVLKLSGNTLTIPINSEGEAAKTSQEPTDETPN